MSEPTPDIFEEDELLAKAARMDFGLQRELHDRIMETPDVQEVGILMLAYSRASRMMRQNLSKLQKQKAERAKEKRAHEMHESWAAIGRPDSDPHYAAIDARTDEVQHAVDRVISAAADGDEKLHTDWVHRFDREVDDWNEKPDWLEDDLDVVIQRVCKTLGLPEEHAQRWRDLPDPTFMPEPEEDPPYEPGRVDPTFVELRARLGIPNRVPPPYDKYESSG